MREREGNATSAVKREATLRRWAGWMDKKIWNRCSLGLGHEGFCSDDWGWDPGGEGTEKEDSGSSREQAFSFGERSLGVQTPRSHLHLKAQPSY